MKEVRAGTLFISAQDTDVLVLAVRRYLKLPSESYFIPKPNELISVKNIYMSLGQSKAAALPEFHAISGCDCTGSLTGKGKLSFWEPFANAPETTISALTNLGSAETQTDEDINELERFICRVYQNNKKNNTLSDLR